MVLGRISRERDGKPGKSQFAGEARWPQTSPGRQRAAAGGSPAASRGTGRSRCTAQGAACGGGTRCAAGNRGRLAHDRAVISGTFSPRRRTGSGILVSWHALTGYGYPLPSRARLLFSLRPCSRVRYGPGPSCSNPGRNRCRSPSVGGRRTVSAIPSNAWTW